MKKNMEINHLEIHNTYTMFKIAKHNLLILILFLTPITLLGQQLNYPLNREINILLNKEISNSQRNMHTGFRPLLQSDLNDKFDADSVVYKYNRNKNSIADKKFNLIRRKLRYEDFLTINRDNFRLAVNPILNLEIGQDIENSVKQSINTRGVELKGDIGKTVSFYSSFYENQAFFIDYIDDYVIEHIVVPGQGAKKSFQETGHDFSRASGYISMTPNLKKLKLNVQLGHSKHFIGEGYRSLLLSDNAYNYPFVKFDVRFPIKKDKEPRFQYVSMFTAFQDFKGEYYYQHNRQHGTFNYLSCNISKRIQLGIFEGIIWHTSDSTYTNRFDINFFNPVMLIRPFQYSLNDENNIILGINGKIKITDNVQAYGQFMLDNIDFSEENGYFENKYGYQAGIKYFGSKNPESLFHHLFLQAEYNYVRPYTYSHENYHQNYSNLNQPLSHPLGAGFSETILIANYRYKDFIFDLKYNFAVTSSDTLNTNFGSNIFLSDNLATYNSTSDSNKVGQGNKTEISHLSIKLGYLINPVTNMQIFIGVDRRNFSSEKATNETNYVFFGFRTALNNYYYDF